MSAAHSFGFQQSGHKRGKPVAGPTSEGGMYMPKCPPVELRGQSLAPRQKRRKPREVKGYRGERI